MFFGGGGRMQREWSGKNVVYQLSVTLEDLYNGATRKLALQKNVICDKCEGRGGKKGAVECCPNCRGTGMQIRIHQIDLEWFNKFNLCAWNARAMGNGSVLKIDVKAATEGR
ncbi:DnaJ homolog subfamily A member 1 [Vulpes lagopus]